MLFQETTPDTSGYMIAGYAIAFLVMALYVLSIYLRSRNLGQDLTMLEEMEEPARPVEASPASQPGVRAAKRNNNKTVTKRPAKN
jgi:hypothetical protein